MADNQPSTPNPWVMISGGFREQSGQDKPNAAVADYLLARGHVVHLVGHHVDPRFFERPRCVVHRVRRPFGSDFLGNFTLRRHGRRVARQVTASHPDARVVVNGGGCCWPDVNWVHFVHSAWRPSLRTMPVRVRCKETIAGLFFRRHERRALQTARLVIADSQRVGRSVIESFRLDPAKVRTIYYGGESTWHPPSAAERAAARQWLGVADGKPLAAFVGGFGHDERKGFDTLFGAWIELCRDATWDVDLVAAGGGAKLDYWRRRTTQNGLGQRIRFLGFTDRVYDVLAAADVLVSPVRYEPYGLNVQEAICRGLPAIVSGRAGIVEQLDAAVGAMVLPDPEDVTDLVRRLRAWHGDVDGWKERFAPIANELRRRGWADMAREFVELVESTPNRPVRAEETATCR